MSKVLDIGMPVGKNMVAILVILSFYLEISINSEGLIHFEILSLLIATVLPQLWEMRRVGAIRHLSRDGLSLSMFKHLQRVDQLERLVKSRP